MFWPCFGRVMNRTVSQVCVAHVCSPCFAACFRARPICSFFLRNRMHAPALFFGCVRALHPFDASHLPRPPPSTHHPPPASRPPAASAARVFSMRVYMRYCVSHIRFLLSAEYCVILPICFTRPVTRRRRHRNDTAVQQAQPHVGQRWTQLWRCDSFIFVEGAFK
jgi:hypothetical protein